DYCITVTDEVAQCDTVYCFTIGYADTITTSVMVTNPPCAGGTDGSVSLRGKTNGVSGPQYSYYIYQGGILKTSQNNVPGTFNYSPLAPGNYMAIVKEGSCTSDSIPFTITEPLPIIVTMTGAKPDNCIPLPRGNAWFSITNGTAPYMLDCGSGFQDLDTIFNLNSGNYVLTVTDDNGCTATLPFHVPSYDDNEDADITFMIDGTPCEGGELIVLYQGLPIPANVGVLWSTGEVNDTITITGTDTLTVNIALPAPIFCLLSDTVQVNCQKILDVDITVQQPLCGEGAVGGPYTAIVIADTSNAVLPVTWYWSFPDTTTTGIYAGIAPGKYYVTVTDGLDSTAIDSFEVIAPNSLTMSFSNIDSTSCPDVCDGQVQITPAGGDANLDYFLYWDPVTPMADTGSLFNAASLCAGLNEFTVSQDGLCFFKDTVEILAPDSVDVQLVQAIDASCYGKSDGFIEVNATGGTPGYTFSWLNGPVSSLYGSLAAGTYHVTATDSKNCMVSDSFSIGQPDTLIADIDSSATIKLSC
ncbi:MAG TPA: SprB repeat-containing protein, partial [Saprospiraceae bacterium]|nr:SprB repeat-containing protein [Saprospiraceae bacterium]